MYIHIAAIAAFQTRRGIDVPDASKVGEKKKKEKKDRKKRETGRNMGQPSYYRQSARDTCENTLPSP